jgi:hypothetical protein
MSLISFKLFLPQSSCPFGLAVPIPPMSIGDSRRLFRAVADCAERSLLGHPPFDLLVRDQLTGVRLLDSSLDLRQQEQTLHGILNRGVVGQSLNRLDHFFSGRHAIILPDLPTAYQACPTRMLRARASLRGIVVSLVIITDHPYQGEASHTPRPSP